MERKHSHYFKPVGHLSVVDVYRVLDLFGVTDPCLQHAAKKLLVAGGRGAGKDYRKDIQEAIDTLQRKLEMMDEDAAMQQAAETVQVAEPVGFKGSAQTAWLRATGGHCPVPAGVPIEYRFRGSHPDSRLQTSSPEAVRWDLVEMWRPLHEGLGHGG